ncbi:hypothetical protein GE061_019795 [Apolygus lucorum]|uniref:snRNA-activating protein complex subunit 4 n=1 Tax=Apolygus lucorum TaxID=248454 RepID=A0A8S9X9D4_APOLU|nr:hypothetical protein GE061_019795 [Apolygus lucorum]
MARREVKRTEEEQPEVKMSDEDDNVTISSQSDGEDELKDAELMKDILQSIENLKTLPAPSESKSRFDEATGGDTSQNPVDLDNLTLIELNVILDQVSQALECNNSLQSGLLMKEVKLLSIKRQIQVFKEGCKRANDAKGEDNKGDIGKYIVSFKAPYFKDHTNFAGYTIVPEKDLPFSSAKYAHKAMQWNKYDMKELENAIKTFLASRAFKKMMLEKPKTKCQKERILKKFASLRKASLNTLIDDDFDKVIDWCHIASRLKKNHTPNECQKAWDTFLRPNINKKKWSKEELEKLKLCALERNFEDWDAIAEDLGTGRSGYQCFYEYVDVLMKTQEGEWSKSEEEFLIKLVKECTYGDKVLWHKHRYGEWTLEEDELLMNLVEKYGRKKWATIAQHIPSRGRVQIRHRYEHLRNKLAMNPGKKLEDFSRPKRPSFKNRKQVNIKYLLDKKDRPNLIQKTKKSDDDDDPDDPGNEKSIIGFDTSFGPLMLRKDDVEGVVVGKKQRYRKRRKQVLIPKVVHEVVFNENVVEAQIAEKEATCEPAQTAEKPCNERPRTAKVPEKGKKQSKTSTKKHVEVKVKVPTKKMKVKTKKAKPKPPADLSVKILEYYGSTSDYVGGPVKPSDVCDGELGSELTNALLKYKPYKYFNHEITDWWYSADKSDPYYKEVFDHVKQREGEEYEIKDGANWLLPPCTTSLDGFYNILVDIDYKPEDLNTPKEQLEEELKELYCAADEETIAAVARWKERLSTLFLWPAALSEIELDKNDEEITGNPTCSSQVLNESEIIQLAEELNQIEDEDLRAAMVKQLGLVESSTQNENIERLNMLVLQDDTTDPIKTEPEEDPGTPQVEMDTDQ